jgi:hypothetical protein
MAAANRYGSIAAKDDRSGIPGHLTFSCGTRL